MNNLDIKNILENNLKDYIAEEVDKQIEQKVNEFRNILVNNKDHYIEHLMKNIRIIHEYNNNNNKINYTITFINEYKVRGENNENN